MSQLLKYILRREAVQEAYGAVSQHIPRGSQNRKYNEILGIITNFVGEIIDIASTSKLPNATKSDPARRMNSIVAFVREKEFMIDELIKEHCRMLSLHGVRHVSILMKKLADTVMAEALLLMKQ